MSTKKDSSQTSTSLPTPAAIDPVIEYIKGNAIGAQIGIRPAFHAMGPIMHNGMQYAATRDNGILTITFGPDDFAYNRIEKARTQAFSDYATTKQHYDALKQVWDATEREVARCKHEIERAKMPADKKAAQDVYDTWVMTLEDGKVDLDDAKAKFDEAAERHLGESENLDMTMQTVVFDLN